MSKILTLFNTFTKNLKPVELNGKQISASNIDFTRPSINGSFYICGPTVYSDCHIGHAITYIRSDLFRRILKSVFNVRILSVMNITDLDDKILAKTFEEFATDTACGLSTDPQDHPFNIIADRYYHSFLKDLDTLRILPTDFYVRVSKHIPLIQKFIKRLEQKGTAYLVPDGDIRFKVSTVKNYEGRLDPRKILIDHDNTRDFTLWKKAKPNEPLWHYETDDNVIRTISGRPGWHVQCSAISSAFFGNRLDFHYGGNDLTFPHHYNEEACSCAYHQLDTSESMHVWVTHWLHSGHLVFKDRKMSKSLGNVVLIKDLVDKSSVNALRLACIASHYRSNLKYDEEFLNRYKSLDHKINSFINFICSMMKGVDSLLTSSIADCFTDMDQDVERAIMSTRESIIDGICNDLDLEMGLNSLLALSKILYSKNSQNLKPLDLVSTWGLLKDWCDLYGLEYSQFSLSSSDEYSPTQILLKFRNTVRQSSLDELNQPKTGYASNDSLARSLLDECDKLRDEMQKLGFVVHDSKSKS